MSSLAMKAAVPLLMASAALGSSNIYAGEPKGKTELYSAPMVVCPQPRSGGFFFEHGTKTRDYTIWTPHRVQTQVPTRTLRFQYHGSCLESGVNGAKAVGKAGIGLVHGAASFTGEVVGGTANLIGNTFLYIGNGLTGNCRPIYNCPSRPRRSIGPRPYNGITPNLEIIPPVPEPAPSPKELEPNRKSNGPTFRPRGRVNPENIFWNRSDLYPIARF